MKEGYDIFFDEFGIFSPKFLAVVRSHAHVLLKRSCMLGKLVNTQTKGLLCYV